MSDKTDKWLRMCDNDVKTTKINLEGEQYMWVSFHCHLIVEKALKAVIAEITDEMPPRIHNLKKLAEIALLYDDLSDTQRDLLKNLTPMNIDGRYEEYDDNFEEVLTPQECATLLAETEDFLCMIKNKLGR